MKECKNCGIANHDVIWYKPKTSDDKKNFKDLEKHYKDYCKTVKQSIIWTEYYNFVNYYNANLRYNYSSTIHKAQGDEWKYVFVDRNNLIHCAKDALLRLTSYYTAISRMKNKVVEVIL